MILSLLGQLAKVPVDLYLVLAALGFFLAVATDQAQILAKHAGSMSGSVARGYNRAMKIMVINRLGAVLYFLLAAFSIDLGLNAQRLAMGLISAMALLAVFTTFIIREFHKSYLPGVSAFFAIRSVDQKELYIGIAAVLANIFNLMGLSVPLLLSAEFPKYRLSVANTGFLFNTIFTVINVFYIESYLAKMIDEKSFKMSAFVSFLLLARLIAYASSAAVLAFAFR